ncbi:MAG: hypothetical protein ABIF10_01465 [Candidatus Woesearchaeota archaeon]
MALFGKKKEPDAATPMAATLPVDQVMGMRQQGFSNDQIIQTLQRDGFNSTQIFDAMNQADMYATGAPQYSQQETPGQPAMGQMQDQMQNPMQYDPGYQQQPYPQFGGERERIEEMAETIIDEKWDELLKNINKIIEWKDKTEQRISKVEQEIKDTKDSFDKLHRALIGKISEYDQNILNVGTEIKAMERVFQKILPTFTENVAELSRITRNVKRPGSSGVK